MNHVSHKVIHKFAIATIKNTKNIRTFQVNYKKKKIQIGL